MPEPSITVTMLGGFAILVDGTLVLDESWNRKKPLEIVKLLALQPGHAMRREQLFATMWPELSTAAAATQLRKSRLYLRERLRDAGCHVELVDASADGSVRLAGSVSVDVDAFTAAASALLQDAGAAKQAADAASLYAGDLLPYDRARPWTEPARYRLRGLYQQALLSHTRHLEAAGELDAAVSIATRVVALDAACEEAHRTLIRLYTSSGRRDLALAQYESCRASLRAARGVEPDAETTRLAERARTGSLSVSATPPDVPLVGRRPQMAELERAFERVQAGSGQAVVVSGEAGIGKTHLAEHFLLSAERRGANVVRTRCHQDEAGRGFDPWIRIIQSIAEPAAGERDPSAPAPSRAQGRGMRALFASTVADQDAMFAQVSAFLRAHARREPLVILVDDVQWIGPDSLRLLRVAVRDSRGAPLMLILTLRSEDADPETRSIIDDVLREPHCREIALGELGRDDVASLVTAMAPGDSPDMVEGVWASARGNPLFVVEVLRSLRGGGEPRDARSTPARVAGVIAQRVARLSPEARDLLSLAAVIGAEFGVTTLGSASGHPPGITLDLLDESRRHRIVGEVEGGRRFAFKHPLMHAVTYDALPLAARASMHLRVGSALEAEYGTGALDHAAELAHHFRLAAGAGGEERALDYSRAAGIQALDNLAFRDAATHLRAALSLAQEHRHEDPSLRVELRLWLGQALYRAEERAESSRVLMEAAADARAARLPELFARVVAAIAGKRRSALETNSDRIALLHEALGGLGEGDIELRCRLTGQLAKELENAADSERIPAGQRAIRLAQQFGDGEAAAQAMLYGLDAIAGPDSLTERLALTGEIVGLDLGPGVTVPLEANIRRYAALIEAGHLEEADRELAALSHASTNHPVADARGWAKRWFIKLAAARAVQAGKFADGERLAGEGLQLSQQAGDPDAVSIFGSQLFELRWHQGRLADLRDIAQAVLASVPDFWPWKAAAALIECESGSEETARAAFERMAGGGFSQIPRDRFWMGTLTILAELCARVGDAERARELAALLAPYSDRNAVLGWGYTSAGSNHRALGVLAAACGDHDAAEGHFDRAIRWNTAQGSLPWKTWSELNCARTLLDRGRASDATRARELASAARGAARECGMASALAAADAILDATADLAPV